MKIIPIVCDEITFEPKVYEPLLKELNNEIIEIVLVPFTTKKNPKLKMTFFLWELYGVVGFIKKSIQYVFLKLLDILSFFIKFNKCYSMTRLAKKNNIPLYHTKDINSSEFINHLKQLEPDIIISSQSHFIGKKLLNIPKLGIVNKHAGMLPKYRGLYPVFWAMLNNEKEIGVTVHFMNDKFDDGDIILQESIKVLDSDTFESMYQKVVAITPELFIKAIKLLEKDDFIAMPNDSNEATYYSQPSRKDIKIFKKSGKKII